MDSYATIVIHGYNVFSLSIGERSLLLQMLLLTIYQMRKTLGPLNEMSLLLLSLIVIIIIVVEVVSFLRKLPVRSVDYLAG